MKVVRRLIVSLLVAVLLGAGATIVAFYHAGYRGYIVHTGSMVPTDNPGELVIDKPLGHQNLHKGEIITFRVAYGTQGIVTHRIHSISKKGIIRTKGDANKSPDAWYFGRGNVLGTQARTIPDLGYVIVFLKQRDGIASIVTGFLSIVLLWGLFFEDAEPRAELVEEPDEAADTDNDTIAVPDADQDPAAPPMVIDIRTDAEKSADAVIAGIRQLRGRHRAPRGGGDRVAALRTGPGRHRVGETTLVGAMHAMQRPAPALASEL